MLKKIIAGVVVFFILLFAGAYFFYLQPRLCPDKYVLLGTSPLFKGKVCIAKYEMKKVDGEAVSTPRGEPWTNLTRADAILACRKIGSHYDLISNSVWTSVAREIASTPENWSGNIVGRGKVNRGHITITPKKNLEASNNDDDSCYLTTQKCGVNEWNELKRTFILPNNKVLWDISGNVAEWVGEEFDNYSSLPPKPLPFTNETIKNPLVSKFGPAVKCEYPVCGFGVLQVSKVSKPQNLIIRGGSWYQDLDESGIFYTMVGAVADKKSATIGFRCMYQIPAN